jgi:hypothetical protein
MLADWGGTIDTDPTPPAQPLCCDACDEPIEGEPAGRGLLIFPRGDDVDIEEPPLCESCARAIGAAALFRMMVEEEEG